MIPLEAKSVILSLDIGGTGIKTQTTSVDHMDPLSPIRVSKHPAFSDGIPHETQTQAKERLRQLVLLSQQELLGRDQIAAVGVDMPDPSDYTEGILRAAHKPRLVPLVGFPFNEVIRPALAAAQGSEVPVFYMNDGDAGARGVMHRYKDSRIVVVTFGDGLGGGFIKDGRLATEEDGAPAKGEIWDLDIHHPSGEYIHTDNASRRLETRASRGAIITRYVELSGTTETEIDVDEIADRSRNGDQAAQQSFREMGQAFGEGLVFIADKFRPERIIVTGGPAGAADQFMPATRQVVETSYETPQRTRIRMTVVSDSNFNLLGTALNAREQLALTA